jgi:putative component of membrane protein insertase Oxa1/YidC/SpoIIIJ protein YidD
MVGSSNCGINVKNKIVKTYLAAREIKHSLLLTFFGVRASCKHSPSCSQQLIADVKKEGMFKGFLKGFWRIITCIG